MRAGHSHGFCFADGGSVDAGCANGASRDHHTDADGAGYLGRGGGESCGGARHHDGLGLRDDAGHQHGGADAGAARRGAEERRWRYRFEKLVSEAPFPLLSVCRNWSLKHFVGWHFYEAELQ